MPKGVKKHSTVIGASTWEINNLGATAGLEGIRLLAAALAGSAPATGQLIAKFMESDEASIDILMSRLSGDDIGSMLGALLGILSRKEVKQLLDLVLQLQVNGLYRDGKPVDFETEFAGDLLTLSKVFFWALRVNYADFSSAVPGLAGGLRKKPAEAE